MNVKKIIKDNDITLNDIPLGSLIEYENGSVYLITEDFSGKRKQTKIFPSENSNTVTMFTNIELDHFSDLKWKLLDKKSIN